EPNGSSLVSRISGRAVLKELFKSPHRASLADRHSGHSRNAIRNWRHQIRTRSSGFKYSLSLGATLKALYQASTLRTVSLRYSPGAWVSVVSRLRKAASF